MMPNKYLQRILIHILLLNLKNFRYSLLSLQIIPVLPFLRQEIADKYHLDKVYDPGNNSKFVQEACKHLHESGSGKKKQLDHWIILQVSWNMFG